ncbi:CPBP family intramembrane metalloprotease [Candidatus Parcubacteria bacterium]|nr:CPBP family intramembrane metalloprotease [Candidatus Parcubacteria bacterium]
MQHKVRTWLQKPLPLIIMASVLAFYSNWPVIYGLSHHIFAKGDASDYVAEALGALVLMLVVPALIIKFVFRRPLRDFGLRLPENMSEAVKLTLATIVVGLSKQPAFQEYYAVKQGFGLFLLLTVLLGAIYYLAEGFIFTGFLFFGLWDRYKYHALWISNLIFALLHIGKPLTEVLWAFVIGLIFTFITYRTKSVLPGVVAHLTLAFVLNVLVNFV